MSGSDEWEEAFLRWIESNEPYLDPRISFAGHEDRALNWYRQVFADNGVIPGHLLTELALAHKRRVLSPALEIVQMDVRQAIGHELNMTLEERSVGVPGSADDIFLLGNRLISMDEAGAVIEIAKIAQSEMMDMLMRVWPSCEEHNAATYAELKSSIPVWWCRRGGHVLRRIGGRS